MTRAMRVRDRDDVVHVVTLPAGGYTSSWLDLERDTITMACEFDENGVFTGKSTCPFRELVVVAAGDETCLGCLVREEQWGEE